MVKFEAEISKKNGLMIQFHIFTYQKGITLFIQCDFNIWWKPEIINNKYWKAIGWLFFQIGYCKHEVKEEGVDKC